MDELLAERTERRKKEAEASVLLQERIAFWSGVLRLWGELGEFCHALSPEMPAGPDGVIVFQAAAGVPMRVPEPNSLVSVWMVDSIELSFEPHASGGERRNVVFDQASCVDDPRRMGIVGTADLWEEYFLSAFAGPAKDALGGLPIWTPCLSCGKPRC